MNRVSTRSSSSYRAPGLPHVHHGTYLVFGPTTGTPAFGSLLVLVCVEIPGHWKLPGVYVDVTGREESTTSGFFLYFGRRGVFTKYIA